MGEYAAGEMAKAMRAKGIAFDGASRFRNGPRLQGEYDWILLAVAHRQFAEMGGAAIHTLGRQPHVLYDLKHLIPAHESDARL